MKQIVQTVPSNTFLVTLNTQRPHVRWRATQNTWLKNVAAGT